MHRTGSHDDAILVVGLSLMVIATPAIAARPKIFVGRSFSSDIKPSRAERAPSIERSEGPATPICASNAQYAAQVFSSSFQLLAYSPQNRYL